ncbi:MAG: tyrosine-type recombinase/integrase [Tessaracoccus sp.]
MLTTAMVRDARNWDQVVIDLGRPNLTWRTLRYPRATWLAEAGMPLHVLQEILVHASIETTPGYLHPDERHLASAAGAGQRLPAQIVS